VVSGDKQKISYPTVRERIPCNSCMWLYFSLSDGCFFVSQSILVSGGIFSWT
jgi:hypothetical protein